MTLLEQTAATLQHRIHAPRGARVLAAVSGGADSVALALLLAALHQRGAIVLSGLAHLNHQLRGGDADEDQGFVASLAERLHVPFRAARVDVAVLASQRGESVEAAARRARYAFLAEAAAELNADYIATGHTLEDQAETVLLRLLRGASSRGLSGIRFVRGAVIRPMLECRRGDVRAFLAERGEAFREDASNADLRIPRNRLRHALLPVIDQLAPRGLEALARTASLAADDEDFLQKSAIVAAHSLVLSNSDGIRLDRNRLAALPSAVARRVIRGAIESVAPLDARRLTSRHVESIWRLATMNRVGALDLPAVQVAANAAEINLRAVGKGPRHAAPFEISFDLPGAVTILEAGWSISAVRRQGRCDQMASHGVEPREALTIAVPAAKLGGSVTIRNRRSGDRIKPVGAPGRKKLQDLFVDRKVPRFERDRIPVVVSANGHIVWVVGVAMSDEFRVTAPELEVVVFTAERQ